MADPVSLIFTARRRPKRLKNHEEARALLLDKMSQEVSVPVITNGGAQMISLDSGK